MQEVSRESCLLGHLLLPTLNIYCPAGTKRFAVIGGGFAGVATAWHLIAQVHPAAAGDFETISSCCMGSALLSPADHRICLTCEASCMPMSPFQPLLVLSSTLSSTPSC